MSDPETTTARGLEHFVASRGATLWRAAWLLTGDGHHAEDLVQTALAKCYPRYEDFEDDERFEAYLRGAMYKTYCSWWRRLSWRNETPSAEIVPDVADEVPTGSRLDIVRALETLPRMQRAVLVLQYLEDRSVAEIAELLGISAGSVKTHSHRGRAAMRQSAHLAEAGVRP